MRAPAKWSISAALRVIVMLPFAPSVYAFSTSARTCFAYPTSWVCHDLLMIALVAPLSLIFGPLSHDDAPPRTPWPEILLTAMLMAIVWWAASRLVKKLRPMGPLRRPPPTSGRKSTG